MLRILPPLAYLFKPPLLSAAKVITTLSVARGGGGLHHHDWPRKAGPDCGTTPAGASAFSERLLLARDLVVRQSPRRMAVAPVLVHEHVAVKLLGVVVGD